MADRRRRRLRAARPPPRASPLAHVRRELREPFLTKERLATALLIVLLLPPFISTFSSLKAQERLWELHESSTTGVGAGISAMPSVHVATAFLIALATRRTNRVAGIVAAVYFVLILVGSVHLGWHYAIDGYVGVVGTWLVKWGVGRLLDEEEGMM